MHCKDTQNVIINNKMSYDVLHWLYKQFYDKTPTIFYITYAYCKVDNYVLEYAGKLILEM